MTNLKPWSDRNVRGKIPWRDGSPYVRTAGTLKMWSHSYGGRVSV
jgi:hypothetical protein